MLSRKVLTILSGWNYQKQKVRWTIKLPLLQVYSAILFLQKIHRCDTAHMLQWI